MGFLKAASEEQSCHGVSIYTLKEPSKPYWFLEVYPVSDSRENFVATWWMVKDVESASNAGSDGSETSFGSLAKKVCFVAKSKGAHVE